MANHCFFHCSRQDRCNGNRLKSAWRSGTATFGTGVMLEAFHSVGTVDVVTDWLNKLVSGLQNTAAQSFKNQAGYRSSPVLCGGEYLSV